MSQLSALIGKSVLDISSSCIIGRVTDVYFDEYLKNAVYFCMRNEDSHSLSIFGYAEAQNILDAVVISDGVKLLSPMDVDVTALRTDVMGMPVFTPNGGDKGEIEDILISASGKVYRLRTDAIEFTPASILSIGNVIIQKSVNKIKSKTADSQSTVAQNANTQNGKIPSAKSQNTDFISSKSGVMPRPKQDYPVYILNDTKKVLEIEKSILSGAPAPQVSTLPDVETDYEVSTDTAVQPESTLPAVQPQPTLPAVPPVTTVPPMTTVPTAQIPKNEESEPALQQEPIMLTKAFTLVKKEPVLSNGAFKILLDGSRAYSYDDDSRTPTRIICDYDFLLGRTLGADLTTYTGELIARQNSVVTDEVVEKARKAGKLVELTLNSIKPTK